MYPEPLAGWRGEGPAEGRENKFQILMEPDSEEVIDDVTERHRRASDGSARIQDTFELT